MRGAVTSGAYAVKAVQRGLRTDATLDGYAVYGKTAKLPRKLKKACRRRVLVDTLASCQRDGIRITKVSARRQRRIWSATLQWCRDFLLKDQEIRRERAHHLNVAHAAAIEELMQQEDQAFMKLARSTVGDSREVHMEPLQIAHT